MYTDYNCVFYAYIDVSYTEAAKTMLLLHYSFALLYVRVSISSIRPSITFANVFCAFFTKTNFPSFDQTLILSAVHA